MRGLFASVIIWIVALWFGPMFSLHWAAAVVLGSTAYLAGAFVEFVSPSRALTGPDRP